MRKYHGYIHISEGKTIRENKLHLIPALRKYYFVACGSVAEYLTYKICSEDGDQVEEFDEVRFIRVKSNGKYYFLINSIG